MPRYSSALCFSTALESLFLTQRRGFEIAVSRIKKMRGQFVGETDTVGVAKIAAALVHTTRVRFLAW